MGEKQSKTVSEAEIQHIQQALALVRKEDKEALREIFRQVGVASVAFFPSTFFRPAQSLRVHPLSSAFRI